MGSMSWNELSDWWVTEVADDPAYEQVVTPLLFEVLDPRAGETYIDLGCGEGRVLQSVRDAGSEVIGVELAPGLARRSGEIAPTVIGELPDLSFFRDSSVNGAYCVLVIEHIEDLAGFFRSVAETVRSGGVFAMVANHPIWTAPDATPISDSDDGEVYWRPGDYFSEGGYNDEPAGDSTVRFLHRSMAELLNTAADAGWSLEKMVEQPHHEFEDQSGIPRLLACRWRLVP
jgi:SAM-dependent methyltransferase